MQPDVSIISCPDYAPKTVRDALIDALAPYGGLAWVTPGMRIVIKVNLLGAHKPERAATTHPTLVTTLCELLATRGATVVVGDSPGGLFTHAFLAPIYRVCGMQAVIATGATLNDDFSETTVYHPDGIQLKSFRCTQYLLDADAIIDVCKLKTHGLVAYTGACKNMFGAIPGMKKSECHYLFPETDAFADMLVDLYEKLKPRLCIADAVEVMEGNGPSNGTPRKIGALLVAKNAHALDLIGARLMGLGACDVPTLSAAVKRGLIPKDAEQLSVSGNWQALIVPDFICSPIRAIKNWGDPHFSRLLEQLLANKPLVDRTACIGCGICARQCPAHAIRMEHCLPVIDRTVCIRCFCCQEFCETGAMQLHKPPLAKILYR
ncbi:MAG: DUF362 domain-containing protein [Clostridia bacterium]